jgi:O-succinylhomoserine sulfhydrylase
MDGGKRGPGKKGERGSADWGLETRLVRGGLMRSPHGETSEAMYLTSGYVYDSAEQAAARFRGDEPGYLYSRYSNPTVSMFEQRLALLEGAEACYGTASGMAAVFAALMTAVKAGDHVVASRALFGSCFFILTQLLPRYGIETTLVDGHDLAAWRAAMRPNTRAAFVESPANPTMGLVDIAAVAAIVHENGAKLVIDNVFATPLFQKPLALGADIVVYSATKHIDGQGRTLGGAILGELKYLTEQVQPFLRHTGPALSPFTAWVLLKGLETLPLRVERQSANALTIASGLESKANVTRVLYPHLPSHPQYELAKRQMSGGGSLVTFELAGGRPAAFAFLDALEIIDISNNLGDAKSIATHPASTTHRAMPEEDRLRIGVTEGLVRISIGLESLADLQADIDGALDAAARA